MREGLNVDKWECRNPYAPSHGARYKMPRTNTDGFYCALCHGGPELADDKPDSVVAASQLQPPLFDVSKVAA